MPNAALVKAIASTTALLADSNRQSSAAVVRRVIELLFKAEFENVLPIKPHDADVDPQWKTVISALLNLCQSKDRPTKSETLAIMKAMSGGHHENDEKPSGKEKNPAKWKKIDAAAESGDSSSSDSSDSDSDSDSDSSDDEKPAKMFKCHTCPGGCKSHRVNPGNVCPFRKKKAAARAKKKMMSD